jgi:hypothetical protein
MDLSVGNKQKSTTNLVHEAKFWFQPNECSTPKFYLEIIMNIENLSVVELASLLENVKAEIKNRKESVKTARFAEREAKKAARIEMRTFKQKEREAKKSTVLSAKAERKLMAEKTKAAKIAALEAKIAELKKRNTPVTGKALRAMGAAV